MGAQSNKRLNAINVLISFECLNHPRLHNGKDYIYYHILLFKSVSIEHLTHLLLAVKHMHHVFLSSSGGCMIDTAKSHKSSTELRLCQESFVSGLKHHLFLSFCVTCSASKSLGSQSSFLTASQVLALSSSAQAKGRGFSDPSVAIRALAMKHLLRLLAAIFLASIASVSLQGCGGSDLGLEAGDSDDTSDEVNTTMPPPPNTTMPPPPPPPTTPPPDGEDEEDDEEDDEDDHNASMTETTTLDTRRLRSMH